MSVNSNLLTTSKITKQTMAKLENNLVIAQKADWALENEFGNGAGQIGDKLGIRRPINGQVRNSLDWVGNLPFEGKIDLVIDQARTMSMQFSEEDMALKVEDFSSRYIDANAVALAAAFDAYVYGLAIDGAYNVVGQYGTAIGNDTIGAARELLMTYATPDDGDIYGVLTQKHNRSLASAQAGIFNAQKEVSDIYRKGRIGEFYGIEFASSNSSPRHEDGTAWTGAAGSIVVSAQSPLTSGWADTGSMTVAGFTTARTLKVGDVFVLSGASGVVTHYNEITKAETEYTQQFVVTEAVTSTTSAGQVVKFAPALIVSGDYKNVAGNLNASVSLVPYSESGKTAGSESIVFHKKAIKLASPKLMIPKNNGEAKMETSDETGLKFRFWAANAAFGAGSSTTPFFGARLDTIFGGCLARREWIVRIR